MANSTLEWLSSAPHRRKNILTGEWLLVSSQRTQRPWQGEIATGQEERRPAYDPTCYLCPGNKRASGEVNPHYTGTYVFTNDFPALLLDRPSIEIKQRFYRARAERGTCRVVNYSPRHDLTMAELPLDAVREVVEIWIEEFRTLSAHPLINYVQIFENKGTMMGNSNPHPHCQIWAQEHLPSEVKREQRQQRAYYRRWFRSLLADYLGAEKEAGVRVIFENKTWIVVTPFWAVWPFETLLAPKHRCGTLLDLNFEERADFAAALQVVTIKYDNLFHTSFPYSMGIHQAPTDNQAHPEWHLHVHFYPPLLRSATIRKFMVGYELLAEPQRDITPEFAAELLRLQPLEHYAADNINSRK